MRAAETRAADNPLVAILNFADNDFGEPVAECQCYVIDDDTNPLTHDVMCGVQVTRCSSSQTLDTQLEFVES